MPGKATALLAPIFALVVGAVPAGSQESPAESASADEEPAADLIVTLQHTNGKFESFKEELVRMDLILDGGGRLDQVHLITRSGPEADTHIWYNVDNLVSVRYQFLTITGKAKVAVRTVTPPQAPPAPAAPRKAIAPLDPEDYR